jgi:hypothetical protein
MPSRSYVVHLELRLAAIVIQGRQTRGCLTIDPVGRAAPPRLLRRMFHREGVKPQGRRSQPARHTGTSPPTGQCSAAPPNKAAASNSLDT